MSSPLDFLRLFADRLREAGIRFAITSGMACVHYGLAQNTKDSDWIIRPEDLAKLRDLFAQRETEGWRISYRSIFGAPLDQAYLGHGWTSHLSVWSGGDSMENKVDIFGQPPRVQASEIVADAEGWADRHVVAQMKRTDRDKDWPFVDGLGLQLRLAGEARSLLHIRDARRLREAWVEASPESRRNMALRRPLLAMLETVSDDLDLERLLAVERAIWENVNRERYGAHERVWKEFYRRWRLANDFIWPVEGPFCGQHDHLLGAARIHRLAEDPLGDAGREALLRAGLQRAARLLNAPEKEINLVLPPIKEMLP